VDLRDELNTEIKAYLFLVVAIALPVVGLWWILSRDRLFGLQRNRAVPWRGAEVLGAFILLAFWTDIIMRLVQGLATLSGHAGDISLTSWATILTYVCEIPTVVFLLFRVSNTQLYQLGLTTQRFWANVAAGSLFWLLLTPLILALNVGVTVGYQLLTKKPVEDHPIVVAYRTNPIIEMWLLIFLEGCIVVPVLEEFLFRGVLQRWLVQSAVGRLIVLILVFLFAARNAENYDWEPVYFGLFGLGIYHHAEWAAWRWLPQPNVARAICTSALLFSVLHPWPGTVALFLLGLVLGYLAHRTQSLVAPITVHALFNGVACLALLAQLDKPGEPPKGNDTTSAVRRPVSAAISSVVPGSW
jgi:membrane protease YdiL (CAAX protease family)